MEILTIGHPDDLETGYGGTLARMSAQVNKTTMFHVAMDDKGHTAIFPDELIATRLLGAQEAGALIVVKVLEVPDLLFKAADLS